MGTNSCEYQESENGKKISFFPLWHSAVAYMYYSCIQASTGVYEFYGVQLKCYLDYQMELQCYTCK